MILFPLWETEALEGQVTCARGWNTHGSLLRGASRLSQSRGSSDVRGLLCCTPRTPAERGSQANLAFRAGARASRQFLPNQGWQGLGLVVPAGLVVQGGPLQARA